MHKVSVEKIVPLESNGVDRVGWVSVATHSHMLRSHAMEFEAAKRNLLEWSREERIAAVGIGSPWEPVSAAHYGHYERIERDRYFGGLVPLESVMDRESIQELIDDLNTRSEGRTLYYLDNETPKNRHGHLWYVGFDYQVPGWHDYSQDHRVQFWDGDPCDDINALTGRPHRRRSYMEVVAHQRRAGALGVWAHPTSWWRQDGVFVTNIAAQMMTHFHADGYVDGMVVQGYDACQRSYQALWFDLLDRDAIVPGFAELDACFDSVPIARKGSFLNYLPCGDETPSLDCIVRRMRFGRHYISSGPHLVLSIDGKPMGARVVSGPGVAHKVRLTALPSPGQKSLSRVELLGRGGAVLAAVDNFAGGELVFNLLGESGGGYVVGRAFGENDSPSAPRQQSIRHCALTNPIYLETPQTLRPAPVETRVTVVVDSGSAFRGGTFRLLTAAGNVLEEGVMRQARITQQAPAGARLEVIATNGERRDIPLAMSNPALREHVEYLAEGRFLRDHPECVAGEVPVSAFRYDAVREAMAETTLRI